MRAWFACTGAELMARNAADTAGRLASAQQQRGYGGTPDQDGAWQRQVAALRRAVAEAGGADWTIALEYDLIRLEKRIDAVLLTDRAILVLEFKSAIQPDRTVREAVDYALDLRDFHAGSRAHPIVPVLVDGRAGFVPPTQDELIWQGVVSPLTCGHDGIAGVFRHVQAAVPAPRAALDGTAWLAAPYRPVPTIIEAATMLYARNGVAEVAAAGADRASLTRTSRAVARAVAQARDGDHRTVVFVTGVPGAGKTLCGLNAVFGPARQDGAAFLTGNVPLVAVLREALARDAVARRECGAAEAARRTRAALQNVHRFLEDHATDPTRLPPERLIVFDEAQRAWDAAKARRGTQNRPGRLTDSEPAHTLEIMSRRPGWGVVVALIGNGQEINTGEAGLAEWGRVIAARPDWRAAAAPRVLAAEDPVQRLAVGSPSWLTIDADLDLTVPIRNVRATTGVRWVDAVLAGDSPGAAAIAAEAGGVPWFLTRDLPRLRVALRALTPGLRRAGIVRSSGAKRLRGEDLAAEVPADAVADWFLNRWPDVRASDALEAAATEYACQGLELDVVGLAWGGDLIGGPEGWRTRAFIGTAWQRADRDRAFILNSYRVLLTRARYETVIWVPRGDAADITRPPAEMDAIAAFLLACGATPLVVPQPTPSAREDVLL